MALPADLAGRVDLLQQCDCCHGIRPGGGTSGAAGVDFGHAVVGFLGAVAAVVRADCRHLVVCDLSAQG